MRAERERLGYSREQIAERAHISPRYLAAIELGEKIPKADVMVRIIRAMGASADAIFYGPQQEVENESKHLAQIILQCTPKERMLIAAIVDTILDVRQRECGLGETEELQGKRALLHSDEQCPFLRIDPLILCAGPSSVFLNKWILLFGKGLFLVILCLRFYIRFLIKVPPLNLRQDGRVMGLLLFTVFLRAS